MTEEIYEYDKECSNCEEENEFEIPKGKTVNDFMIGQRCSNCDCLVKE